MTSNSAIRMIETNSNVKEGSQDSLTQKNIVRTCLQVHVHGEWMLPSLMRSFVRQSSIRELCTLAFHELTVDLLLPVCYNRIHTHTLRIVALRLATLQALALQEDFPDADFLWKQEAPKSRAK